MSYAKIVVAMGSSALLLALSGCGIMAGGSSLYHGLTPHPEFPEPVAAAPAPAPAPMPEPAPAVAKPQGSIYFDVNQSAINAAGQAVIASWASYLAATPAASITVSANADVRGSSSYNKLLADRRAASVVTALIAQGVAPGRMQIVNNGSDKPLVAGNDEAAWAQNRRVDIVEQ